jgi:hypothetical protein
VSPDPPAAELRRARDALRASAFCFYSPPTNPAIEGHAHNHNESPAAAAAIPMAAIRHRCFERSRRERVESGAERV